MPPRKIAGIAVAALFALLALGWFAGLCLEKYYLSRLERYFNAMPGRITIADIEVFPFRSEARLTDFSSEFTDARGGRHFVTADTLVLTSLNLSAEGEAAVVDLASRLEAESVFLHYGGPDFANQRMELELSVAKVDLRNIRGNLAHMKKTVIEDYAAEPVHTLLATVEIGRGSFTDAVFKSHSLGGTLEAGAAALSFDAMRTGEARNLASDNLYLRFQNNDMARIGTLRLGFLHVPEVRPLPPEMGMDFTMAIFEKLRRDPLRCDSLFVEDFLLYQPSGPAFSVGQVNADIRLGTEEGRIVAGLQRIALPGDLLPAFDGRSADRAFSVSAEIDARLHKKQSTPGRIELAKFVLHEPGLGHLSVSGEFLFSSRLTVLEFMLESWGSDILVRRCTVSLTDKGIVDHLLTGAAASSEAATDIRAKQAAQFSNEAEKTHDRDQRVFTEGLAAFVAEPGTLRLTISPKDPVRLDNLFGWNTPPLNLKAVFSSD